MSRANDAFSSLISASGVDTSCFAKRSLNDLKSKNKPKQEVPVQVPLQKTPEKEEKLDVTYASVDLDSLGKPSAPQTSQQTAPLEDLFDDIPGCQPSAFVAEEIFDSEPEWIPAAAPSTEEPKTSHSQEEANAVSVSEERAAFPSDETKEFQLDDRRKEEFGWEEEEASYFSSGKRFEEDSEGRFEDWNETNDDSFDDASFWESKARSTDFKSKFNQYRETLNIKAKEMKKKGLRAVRQGFDAAQEWMDKKSEERKQSQLEAQQKREDAKTIEMFLSEMEMLSHFRREELMRDVPPEFFEKVVQYAEEKGIEIDHLFVTSTDPSEHERAPLKDDDEEDVPAHSETPPLDEPDVPGDCLEVTGEEESQSPSEQEDFDLLGLTKETQSTDPNPQRKKSINLADPDDLDAFFTGGGSVQTEPTTSQIPRVVFQNEDLMKFEGKACSQSTSDLSAMYSRLKQSGHTEEEIRSILKETRKQEKENKMAAALKAKTDREREVEEVQELQHVLKEKHRCKIAEWKDKHANNMRGLLTSLQTVLWEGSGWTSLTVADVLEMAQVKKAYMKANLIIHPDKVKQKGGSHEQVVLADMVFNVLKEAWIKFQS